MRWITCGVMPKMRCVPTPRLPQSTISSTVSSDILTASPRRKLAEKAVYSQRNSGLGKNVKISLETCLVTHCGFTVDGRTAGTKAGSTLSITWLGCGGVTVCIDAAGTVRSGVFIRANGMSLYQIRAGLVDSW